MQGGSDLFESLRASVDARYISDLCYPAYRGRAIRQALAYDAEAFPLAAWNDLAMYLLKIGPFETVHEVKRAMQDKRT